MATEHKDAHVFFAGISIGDFQADSYTGQSRRFLGHSFSQGFLDNYDWNPNNPTPGQVGRALATIIKQLAKMNA